MDAATIQNIVKQVLAEMGANASAPAANGAPFVLSKPSSRPGVFPDAASAIEAANAAQQKLRKLGIAGRKEAIRIIKTMCAENATEWGKIEFAETKVGRLDHKIEKLHGIANLPGTEWLSPLGMSGDHGISLEEQAPFGTVAAISPVTHSIPTISSNAVSMIAAGNSLVVNAHPNGAKCAAMAVAAFNEALDAKLGLRNLVTIIEEPSLESFDALIKSPGIDLICVTGGPAVVKAAMASGKRAICAGPGNPPVLVDATADLDKAARDIILGAAYDNNLLCIGEKQVFVVDAVFDAFLRAMEKAGAMRLNDAQLQRLTEAAFTYKPDGGGCSHPVLNRKLVGADATVLAQEAGTSAPKGTELLFAVTNADHPFVQEEQMMPMLPIVRVRDVAEGIERCRQSEHNYRHSAICHSRDIGVLTEMGRAMNCTLFVKNGPSFAGLGMGGEGYLNFTIATTTGEGIVTPATFTRKRRCVMVDNLNIVG
ncbi:MAG: aldehyde dehydrogenase EutE [Verrucomicrobiota bacterium JB022]|nr:aldehyde dehydrogenase EutE [Verrucomicrobiota bacterium JB022]